MRLKIIYWFLFILLTSPIYAVDISSCSVLDTPNTVYYLTADIIDSTNETCIQIAADNITLDCQGYVIDGVDENKEGILAEKPDFSELSGVVIKNCKLRDWHIGVNLGNGVNPAELINISATSGGIGVHVYRSYHNFTNINASSNDDYGIYLFYANYCNLINITTNNNLHGLMMDNSHHNTIINLTSNYNGNYGIHHYRSDYNTITNSTFSGNTVAGVHFYRYGTAYPDFNIYYNNIFNNSINIEISSTDYPNPNYFNTTKQLGVNIYTKNYTAIGGNFWADPEGEGYSETCEDSDRDGFCDEPLNLSYGNSEMWDYLPLSTKPTKAIDSCSNLTEGIGYYLGSNIIDSQSKACINITANNVTLDCLGHVVDGISAANAYGVLIERATETHTNAIIRNCVFMDWTMGIYLHTAMSNEVININATGNAIGISIFYADYSVVRDTSISDSSYRGIDIYHGDNSIVTNTTFENNEKGIWIQASSNIIANSTFNNNSEGIHIYSGGYNKIYNNLLNNTNNFIIDDGISAPNYLNTTKQQGIRIYTLGNTIGGNYWTNPSTNGYSDTCDDSDCDGFCDNYLNLTNGTSVAIDYMPLSIYIKNITLLTQNNTFFNTTTVDFAFNINTNALNVLCELFINDTGYGKNTSVQNNTQTTITANSTLSEGNYNWYINCTAGKTKQSEIRIFTIDITKPIINIIKLIVNNLGLTPLFYLMVDAFDLHIDSAKFGTIINSSWQNNQTTLNIDDILSQSGYVYVNDSAKNINSTELNYTITNNTYQQNTSFLNSLIEQRIFKEDILYNYANNNVSFDITHNNKYNGNLIVGGNFVGGLENNSQISLYSEWSGDWLIESNWRQYTANLTEAGGNAWITTNLNNTIDINFTDIHNISRTGWTCTADVLNISANEYVENATICNKTNVIIKIQSNVSIYNNTVIVDKYIDAYYNITGNNTDTITYNNIFVDSTIPNWATNISPYQFTINLAPQNTYNLKVNITGKPVLETQYTFVKSAIAGGEKATYTGTIYVYDDSVSDREVWYYTPKSRLQGYSTGVSKTFIVDDKTSGFSVEETDDFVIFKIPTTFSTSSLSTGEHTIKITYWTSAPTGGGGGGGVVVTELFYVTPEVISINITPALNYTIPINITWSGEPTTLKFDYSMELMPYIIYPKKGQNIDIQGYGNTTTIDIIFYTNQTLEQEITALIKKITGKLSFKVEYLGSIYVRYIPVEISIHKEVPLPPIFPICGNGICEPGENWITCPEDCGGESVIKGIITLMIVGTLLLIISRAY